MTKKGEHNIVQKADKKENEQEIVQSPESLRKQT